MAKRTTTSKTTAKSAATAERQRQALELRKSGCSYDMIAAKLGYSDRKAAWKSVHAALAEIVAEPAEAVRKLELERLDQQHERLAIHQELAGAEMAAKLGAVMLKVAERRARLLGLDAPVKVQEVPPAKLSDEELASELEAELARLRARRSV